MEYLLLVEVPVSHNWEIKLRGRESEVKTEGLWINQSH